MPQPLRSFFHPILFGPAALDYRPVLAVHIGKIATAWSHVELHLGLLLAALLRSEAEAGAAMYLELAGAGSRAAALQGAAEYRLSQNDQANFLRLFKSIRCTQKRRNKVAHAVWGATDDQPDALIWSDPDEHIAEQASLHSTLTPQQIRAAISRSKSKKATFWIWKEPDFTDILHAINKYDRELNTFIRQVRNKYHAP